MTEDAFAYVSGPDTVAAFTGVPTTRTALGGAAIHGGRSGVATCVVGDEDEARGALARPARLPARQHRRRSASDRDDRPGRPRLRRRRDDRCRRERPRRTTCAIVIGDVLDARLVPRAARRVRRQHGHRPRPPRRPAGRRHRQPARTTGPAPSTSRRRRKAARFVQWCDAFNLPLVTFVDTPGFEPGQRPRVAGHDPPRRRARARLRRRHRAPALRRAAQGVRRRLHRHGLPGPRERLVRGLAHCRDRGDGRARGGADPPRSPPRGHRRRRTRARPSRPRWTTSTRTGSRTRSWQPSGATSTT